MNLRIAGMGWVTPLGRGADSVWTRLLHGDEAVAQSMSDPISDRTYFAFRIPAEDLKDLSPHPRLRRVSAISRFAAAAGLDALTHARSTIGEVDMKRTGLVLAVCNGGVTYTKRFYHDVVESDAQSASPLLFPETVFNAPASHLAAIMAIAGATYTLVGDGAVGILAMKMANDLMDNESLDFCLVVGAEEADWVLCDAYQKWRLLKMEPPIELFHDPPRGMIPSEGAGAVLLAREGAVQVDAVHAGGNFSHRGQANEMVQRILHDLAREQGCIVLSANGTFVDFAEHKAVLRELPDALVYAPKPALGESVGASALWQIIAGAQVLMTQSLPPTLHPDREARLHFATTRQISCQAAIVLTCGLNQQVAGLRLSI